MSRRAESWLFGGRTGPRPAGARRDGNRQHHLSGRDMRRAVRRPGGLVDRTGDGPRCPRPRPQDGRGRARPRAPCRRARKTARDPAPARRPRDRSALGRDPGGARASGSGAPRRLCRRRRGRGPPGARAFSPRPRPGRPPLGGARPCPPARAPAPAPAARARHAPGRSLGCRARDPALPRRARLPHRHGELRGRRRQRRSGPQHA